MADIDLGLGPDQVYKAIREGVHDAMWQMITNSTDMPCADFYEQIKTGVQEAILELDLSPIKDELENNDVHPNEA